jgi:hypothetical protein
MSLEEELIGIEETVRRVVRGAYLRPLLRGGRVGLFQLEEEEADSMLEGYQRNISADMDMLMECIKAAYYAGSATNPAQPMSDRITVRGNQ